MTTTTIVLDFHRGAALAAARYIVVAVPLAFGALYWLIVVRPRKGRGER